MNHSEIVSFIWGVADLIRDAFRRGKCQDIILPLTVLRRVDCVLAPIKKKVLERFRNVDLHPDRIPNPMMGTIFEELIRKSNEALNENPGEQSTPRDVRSIGHFGTGDLEVRPRSREDQEAAKGWLQRSYEAS